MPANTATAFYLDEKKAVLLLGHIFFIVLTWFSLEFFRERMTTSDAAYYNFLLIQDGKPVIVHNRWSSYFVQLLPLMAVKMSLSLAAVLKIYSASLIVFQYFFFAIIVFILKDYRAGFALLLSLCLTFRGVFYFPITELFMGFGAAILCWSVIKKMIAENKMLVKNIFAFVVLLLFVFLTLFHPAFLVVIVFLLLFELSKGNLTNIHLWALMVFGLAWNIARTKLFPLSEYEADKMPSIADIIKYLPELEKFKSTNYFMHFVPNFWTSGIVVVLIIYLGIRAKKILPIVVMSFTVFGWLALILVIDRNGTTPNMTEYYYTLFGIFLALPFTDIFFEKVKSRIYVPLLAMLFAINLFGIYNSGYIYRERVQYFDRLNKYVHQSGNSKGLLAMVNFQWGIGWGTWAFPYETLLNSSLAGPDSAVSIYITNDMARFDSIINDPELFLGPDWCQFCSRTDKLNPDYFKIKSGAYYKININQGIIGKQPDKLPGIELRPLQEKIYSATDTFIITRIELINNTGTVFPSMKNDTINIGLDYHIYDSKGNMLVFEGQFTSLETDLLKGSTVQGMTVLVPKEKGEYIVEVDMLNAGIRWFEINSRFQLIVK